ncbi:hypothetical protein RCL_jg743.t1 [Rhizophagus clarus]|uniref:Uncharacterized protein n=1 Tax=Rhizophagus clarus TaxID=94130 RepID=A0A8H3LE59_9GLOM|nr:hypothetical protein RCL_jg743.t1 [Rhizophagus clarus]
MDLRRWPKKKQKNHADHVTTYYDTKFSERVGSVFVFVAKFHARFLALLVLNWKTCTFRFSFLCDTSRESLCFHQFSRECLVLCSLRFFTESFRYFVVFHRNSGFLFFTALHVNGNRFFGFREAGSRGDRFFWILRRLGGTAFWTVFQTWNISFRHLGLWILQWDLLLLKAEGTRSESSQKTVYFDQIFV